MRKICTCCILFVLNFYFLKAQTLYFPPLIGSAWDTMNPQDLNWCQSRIDSLYNYLQAKNTKSFIVLKNGKIVLEKYFGSYNNDSVFYWASASKSLASFITGIAQQKGFVSINTKVSQYIGVNWTNAGLPKENLITVKHLLQMTSGLDDGPPLPCDNEDTSKTCLIYKVDAGTRWAYHTGAYKKVQDVVSTSVGQSYNTITTNWIKVKTGMSGFWFDQTYYSKARDMARFGLVTLNKGIWSTDTLLKDSLYFKEMTTTSQNFNRSYGYLWWLNGKTTFMNPGLQLVLNGPLIPNAPADTYAALGKNDQKIYIVPSSNMVVIRQGNTAEGITFALSNFDNNLWDYINKLNCNSVSLEEEVDVLQRVRLYPNPAREYISITSEVVLSSASILSLLGQNMEIPSNTDRIDVSKLPKGVYFLKLTSQNGISITKKVIVD